MVTLLQTEKYLRNLKKYSPEIQTNIANITNEVLKRDFEDAIKYLTRPNIGGSKPRIKDINLPFGQEFYHFYSNGRMNEYRVLYLVNRNEKIITFVKIVEPKDHGYINEVAQQEYKLMKFSNYNYVYEHSRLNANVDVRKNKCFFNVDENQRNIIKKLEENTQNKIFFVIGGAGTGKTITAIELFKNLILKNFNVVYLTFTENLLKDTKEKLIMTGFPVDQCYTVNKFFMKKQPNSKENHLKIIQESIKEFEMVEDNDLEIIQAHPSFFDIHFLYSIIRGFIFGGLNPKNNFEKYNVDDSLAIERLKNVLEIKHLEDEVISRILNTINIIIRKYITKKINLGLLDDNDFSGEVDNRPDIIVIDEFQDLTEFQIVSIIKASKTNKVYFFGDPQQVINPTFFQIERIRNLLTNFGIEKPEILNLKKNYRNTEELLKYANHLISIRKENLRKNDFNEKDVSLVIENNESLTQKKHQYSIARIHDKKITQILFKKLSHASDTTIIVNNLNEKIRLVKQYNLDDDSIKKFIFTIQEYKGLENSNIIIYNLIHHNAQSLLELFEKRFSNSKYHEEVFNKYYVAITRSTKSILICETESIDKFIGEKLYYVPFNIKKQKFNEIPVIENESQIENYIDFSLDYKKYIEVGDQFIKHDKYVPGIEKYLYGISLLIKELNTLRHKDYLSYLKGKSELNIYESKIIQLLQEIIVDSNKYLGNDKLDLYLNEIMKEVNALHLPKITFYFSELLNKGEHIDQNIEKSIQQSELAFDFGSLDALTRLKDSKIKSPNSYTLKIETIIKMNKIDSVLNPNKEINHLDSHEIYKLISEFDAHLLYYNSQKKHENSSFIWENVLNEGKFLFELANHFLMHENQQDALSFFKQSARQGHYESTFQAGLRIKDGVGVQPSLEEAVYYFELGLKKNHPKCAYELGLIYIGENSTYFNPEKAFNCFTIAHQLGNSDASYELAQLYEKGLGVGVNIIRAHDMYDDLSKQGFVFAEEKLNNQNFAFLYAQSLENLANQDGKYILKAFQYYKDLASKGLFLASKKIQDKKLIMEVYKILFFSKDYNQAIDHYNTYEPEKTLISLHMNLITQIKTKNFKKALLLLDEVATLSEKYAKPTVVGLVKIVGNDEAVIEVNQINYGFYKDIPIALRKVHYKLNYAYDLFQNDLVLIHDLNDIDILDKLIHEENINVNNVTLLSRIKKLN